MDKKIIFSDFKFLIKHTRSIVNNPYLADSEKGLGLITAYSAANSLYEKFTTIILKEIVNSYTKDLRKNSKKMVLLKYRSGKRLNNMNKKEIDEFLENIRNEKIITNEFVDAFKSLKEIQNLFLFLQIQSEDKERFINLLAKRGLTFSGLQEQLEKNYTDDRTRIIHGDFKDFKTVYYLFRNRYLDFLINLYIAMRIINKAEYL